MKNSRMCTMILAAFILLLAPMFLSARGAGDSSGDYGRALQVEFDGIFEDFENGILSKEQAMDQIREFQQLHDRVNRDDFQLMESCLNNFQSGEMTKLQAKECVEEMIQLRTEEKLQTREKLQAEEKIQTQERLNDEGQIKQNGQKGDSGTDTSRGN